MWQPYVPEQCPDQRRWQIPDQGAQWSLQYRQCVQLPDVRGLMNQFDGMPSDRPEKACTQGGAKGCIEEHS